MRSARCLILVLIATSLVPTTAAAKGLGGALSGIKKAITRSFSSSRNSSMRSHTSAMQQNQRFTINRGISSARNRSINNGTYRLGANNRNSTTNSRFGRLSALNSSVTAFNMSQASDLKHNKSGNQPLQPVIKRKFSSRMRRYEESSRHLMQPRLIRARNDHAAESKERSTAATERTRTGLGRTRVYAGGKMHKVPKMRSAGGKSRAMVRPSASSQREHVVRLRLAKNPSDGRDARGNRMLYAGGQYRTVPKRPQLVIRLKNRLQELKHKFTSGNRIYSARQQLMFERRPTSAMVFTPNDTTRTPAAESTYAKLMK